MGRGRGTGPPTHQYRLAQLGNAQHLQGVDVQILRTREPDPPSPALPPPRYNLDNVSFRLRPFFDSSGRIYGETPDAQDTLNDYPDIYDRFNVPTICIHYGEANDICDTANIPGIPRFKSLGLPSISDHYQSLINTLASEKASDCSTRTEVNFGAAMLWAYGTADQELFPDIPQIAAERPGAWVESIELALRMRNLEMMVNLPPIDTPICASPSAGIPCRPIQEIEANAEIPLYERPVKAFWSAFRNLGGGSNKASSGNQDSFSKTFTLTEIPPRPFNAPPSSLSGFLIPTGEALQKHYLDLQAFSLNLATFYTTFTSVSGKFQAEGLDVTRAEAACTSSKTALPVPGYILGFIKNPAVMTYYAVKGEAYYTGLFFPFADTRGIKMSAYAAAKPFGGRIGPRLFSISPDGERVLPRNEPGLSRSAPYVSGFDTNVFGDRWEPGLPLPISPNFWIIDGTRPLGGTPIGGAEIYFGIPNLVYDFESIGDIIPMDGADVDIEILGPALSQGLAEIPKETLGLYNTLQYQSFRSNLVSGGSNIVLTPEVVVESLNRARRPTRYEALNYLIPTLGNGAEDNLESPHLVIPHSSDENRGYLELYAPLYGKDTLYENNIDSIINMVGDYLNYGESAIDKYLAALDDVADNIRNQATVGSQGYGEAANKIHNGNLAIDPDKCDDLSMAQTFNQYFKGNSTLCQIIPLKDSMRTYFSNQLAAPDTGEGYQHFYRAPYTKPRNLDDALLRSAYFPGPRQGANPEGVLRPPFPRAQPPALAKRNHYSTKLFAIEKIRQGGDRPYDDPPLYLEIGRIGATPTDDGVNIGIHNTLQVGDLRDFGSPLPH